MRMNSRAVILFVFVWLLSFVSAIANSALPTVLIGMITQEGFHEITADEAYSAMRADFKHHAVQNGGDPADERMAFLVMDWTPDLPLDTQLLQHVVNRCKTFGVQLILHIKRRSDLDRVTAELSSFGPLLTVVGTGRLILDEVSLIFHERGKIQSLLINATDKRAIFYRALTRDEVGLLLDVNRELEADCPKLLADVPETTSPINTFEDLHEL